MNKQAIIKHIATARGIDENDPNLLEFVAKLETLWNAKGPKAQRLAFDEALTFGLKNNLIDSKQELIDLPFDEDPQ